MRFLQASAPRRFLSLAFAAALVLFLQGGPVLADSISVDEHGNGFDQTTSGGIIVLHSALVNDPGPGGLPGVLTYNLPFVGTQGDVLALGGTSDNGALNDVLRFNGNGTLLFYSDNTDGVDSLADTPSPPTTLYANQVNAPENGPEGNNSILYTPLPGQPGYDPVALPTYDFVSDGTVTIPSSGATPEPASLAMLGIGCVTLAGYGWRRRKAARA